MPHAVQRIVPVVEQVRMAKDTYRFGWSVLKLLREIVPGQFFMIRALGGTIRSWAGRSRFTMSMKNTESRPGLDFGYVVIGKLTSLMSTWKPGETCEIWGPLGNGFPVPECRHLMCVAGGIGQTPFLAVLREAVGEKTYGDPPRRLPRKARRVSLCYGVRSKDYLAGLEDFSMDGIEPPTFDGRWQLRPSWLCHGSSGPIARGRQPARLRLHLRPRTDDAPRRRTCAQQQGVRVLAVPRNPDGLRHRGLL